MKKLLLGLIAFGLASHSYAQIIQTEQLKEVVVEAMNYKYLNQLDNSEAAIPVQMLERKVAAYDVTQQSFYEDDFDFYTVSFYIPEGKIVAVYNPQGQVTRTIERFNDVALPRAIQESLYKRFPNWQVANDTYKVNYHETKGVKKSYKIKLVNGDKTMRVKMTEDGQFL
ncbi:nicotinate-nucleotide adenylyltransferase [Zeaxanthinibacter sp. PT1]|uniref:nicotinate-nucleotide adenylyltransferase n=1 Tax=Zeaxanthinibacter TaxID=561554 RepID=UPI00234A9DC5|nr:nicotinate-nucleotide adenylyltransferase [Zeaxanthinibacter sp. PT1]MDC6350404.1 nicotinate-nucleotide adenylyltransferase [Zeaxanthinibacter sp. PT1]